MMLMVVMVMMVMMMMPGGLTSSKEVPGQNINDGNNDFEGNCENVAGRCLKAIKRQLTLKQQC